jgi:S1-C subfamily serine protease
MSSRLVLLGLLLAGLMGETRGQDVGDAAIRESVVKIFATSRAPDMLRPWTKQNPREATGTGVVLAGNRILTNAHVVLYAGELSVQSSQSGEKLPARVEAVGADIDLAVLRLEDESFFENRKPLPLAAKLPSIKDNVTVYGYPTGGTSLSITQGIVSRIEFVPFFNQVAGLRIQIDAAINPGNSGGPAIVGGELIGLAFSRLQQADNIGYIIPTEEIELFLKDVEDGSYDGKPTFFDMLQTLENPALRAKLKLGREVAGLVVHEPAERSDDYPLKEWDVLTRVGDVAIDNTGLVQATPELRVRFQYLVQKLAKDGKLPMTLVREGKEMQVEVPVPTRRPSLIPNLQGGYPSYFIYGPLVFSNATGEFLLGFEQNAQVLMTLSRIGSPLVSRRSDIPAFPGEELVVVSSPMFTHKVARGYSNPFSKVLKSVNGTPVKNLKHLVELIQENTGEFVEIAFADKNAETIVFRRSEIEAATEDILTDNGIRKQYSDDLADVVK